MKTTQVGCGITKNGKPCAKVCDPGQVYCPHHLLLLREQPEEDRRRMEKARMGKEKAALMREMLAASPLAAVNPKYDSR